MTKTSSSSVVIMMSVLVVVAVVVSGCDRWSNEGAADSVSVETVTLHYDIKGMHCGGCVNAIAGTTGAMEGVTDAVVSLEDGTADITVTKPNMAEAIRQAIVDLGYEVTLKTSDPPAPGA